MSAFIKNIQRTAFRHKLWKKGSSILIGVSGGPDSACLLDILASLQEKYNWKLRIVHVNYRLRGQDSDQDEAFVRQLARKYHLPISVFRPAPQTDNSNLEARLRDIRYAFFERIRKRHGFDAIAIAHTRDDQAETFLLRLLRGTGLEGLKVMRPRNGHIIRPLLETSRADVLSYIKEHQLFSRNDASNTDLSFTRNRIRHNLIPFLQKEFQPNIKTILARAASIIADDYHLLTTLIEPAFPPYAHKNGEISFSQKDFQMLSSTIQRHFLRHCIKKLFPHGYSPTFHQLEEIFKALNSTKNKTQTLAFKQLKIIRKGATVTWKHID